MQEYAKGVLEALGWVSQQSRRNKSNEEVRRKIDRAIVLIVHAQGRNIQDELKRLKRVYEGKKAKEAGS